MYNGKYLKTKVKSYDDKVNTNFNKNEIPTEGDHCVRLSIILIDFVSKIDKYYYTQIFLEECKSVVKETKMSNFIDEDILLTLLKRFLMKRFLIKSFLIKEKLKLIRLLLSN